MHRLREWFGPPEDGSYSGPCTCLRAGPLTPPGPPGPDPGGPGFRHAVSGPAPRWGATGLRFSPCDPSVRFACEPSLIPQLPTGRAVRGGAVRDGGDRVVVDVDFTDQNREFTATNPPSTSSTGGGGGIPPERGGGGCDLRPPRTPASSPGGSPAGNFGLRASAQAGSLEPQTVLHSDEGVPLHPQPSSPPGGGGQGFVPGTPWGGTMPTTPGASSSFLSDPTEYGAIPTWTSSPSGGGRPPGSLPGLRPIQLYRYANEPGERSNRWRATSRLRGWPRGRAPGVRAGGSASCSGGRLLRAPVGPRVAPPEPAAGGRDAGGTYITAAATRLAGIYNPERLLQRRPATHPAAPEGLGGDHQRGSPTWRLRDAPESPGSGSRDVDVGSVEWPSPWGSSRQERTFKRGPGWNGVTFLQALRRGDEAPFDRVTGPSSIAPRRNALEDPPPVAGTFLVFTTLRPFQRPPSVPSLALDAEDGGHPGIRFQRPDLRGSRSGDRLAGGPSALTSPRVRSQGLISFFALGAWDPGAG